MALKGMEPAPNPQYGEASKNQRISFKFFTPALKYEAK